MPLLKSDADKLLGKKVTLRYTQRYTNGRSEDLSVTGKVIEVSEHGITLFTGYSTTFGFRARVEHVIGLAKIFEVK